MDVRIFVHGFVAQWEHQREREKSRGSEKMKKYQRMISMASRDKIYHQSGCPYIKRIKDKNSVIVLTKEARKMGYRACKCCNTGKFVYKHYDGGIKTYAK